MARTTHTPTIGPSDIEVRSTLLHPAGAQHRIQFAKNVVEALKRAGHYTQRQFFHAVKKQSARLTPEVTKQSLATWQHLYDGEDKARLASTRLCARLLEIVRVFLPEYTELRYLADDALFRSSTGVGSSYPSALRLSMGQAFEQWLENGQEPKDANLARGLAGEYVVCFPWLESTARSGKIARGRARIQRRNEVWTFESHCNFESTGLLLFAGQLCFTGEKSAVLVGFTSFPLPSMGERATPFRMMPEMIVHPYRAPDQADGWWHGSTTFLDARTLEYTATVGHVMRRISPVVPADHDWHLQTAAPSPMLDESSPEHEAIARELERCRLVSR